LDEARSSQCPELVRAISNSRALESAHRASRIGRSCLTVNMPMEDAASTRYCGRTMVKYVEALMSHQSVRHGDNSPIASSAFLRTKLACRVVPSRGKICRMADSDVLCYTNTRSSVPTTMSDAWVSRGSGRACTLIPAFPVHRSHEPNGRNGTTMDFCPSNPYQAALLQLDHEVVVFHVAADR
jgi:hypothetical protein